VANKILEKTLNNVSSEDLRSGYAAPGQVATDAFGNSTTPPVSFADTADSMSVTGSARAAMVLFAILVAVGTWAWISVPDSSAGLYLVGSLIVALVLGLVTSFKPHLARATAPLYAAFEGVVLGLISKIYEDAYNGIVVQAVLATGAIVFVMYTLYSTRIVKVTPRFQRVVGAAMLAAMLFYGVTLISSLFGSSFIEFQNSGLLGIILPVIMIAIGAGMLATDFDFIERGSQQGLPKYMNWAAAYGLIVSIVWIYIHFLRLIANSRR